MRAPSGDAPSSGVIMRVEHLPLLQIVFPALTHGRMALGAERKCIVLAIGKTSGLAPVSQVATLNYPCESLGEVSALVRRACQTPPIGTCASIRASRCARRQAVGVVSAETGCRLLLGFEGAPSLAARSMVCKGSRVKQSGGEKTSGVHSKRSASPLPHSVC